MFNFIQSSNKSTHTHRNARVHAYKHTHAHKTHTPPVDRMTRTKKTSVEELKRRVGNEGEKVVRRRW